MGEEEITTIVDQEELSHENTRLKHLIVLVSSLISISHSIKIFSAKWQCVRAKLEELYNSLIAIENCEPSSSSEDSSSLFGALGSIWDTLKNCDDLARRCYECSFSGKLLMQSDLDMLCSKLDFHVKSLCDIYALGLLKQSYALVVSRPSVSSSKDDVTFYISDLLSRLKIGSSDMKKQAMVLFNEAVQEDQRYAKIATEMDGFVNSLVNFLDSQESEIQEEAAKSLCLISSSESCKSILTVSGVISPLIRVIESGNKSGKEFSARCLMKLTENSDNVWSVSAHGGVTVLLKICSNNSDCAGELVALACGVLKNLVGVVEIKRFMVEEGAIYDFVRLVRSKDEATQASVVDLLQAIAYRDESIREMIIKEGGIRALVSILNPKSSVSTKTREVAFKGITNICCSSKNSINLLIEDEFIDHILYFLRFGEISVQELALKATFWLCGTSEEAKKVMGEEGFMHVLVKFLDSKSFEIREMAAETLSSMLMVAKNRKKFAQNDQIVGALLQMLDPEEVNSGNKKLLLSILMSLTSSNSARKKIASSGYMKNIEKLAEAEVSDAKKIVRKLSCNKFRSMLSGFLAFLK